MFSFVPETNDRPVNGIGYYFYIDRQHRDIWYQTYSQPADVDRLDGTQLQTSDYTKGVRLPALFDLIEIPLALPSDYDHQRLIENGGDLLDQHTWFPLQEHADRNDMRFADPVLLSIRTTSPMMDKMKLVS